LPGDASPPLQIHPPCGNPGPGFTGRNTGIGQDEGTRQHPGLFTDFDATHDNRAQADGRAAPEPDRRNHQIATLRVMRHDAGRAANGYPVGHFNQRWIGNGGRIDGHVAPDLHTHQAVIELRKRRRRHELKERVTNHQRQRAMDIPAKGHQRYRRTPIGLQPAAEKQVQQRRHQQQGQAIGEVTAGQGEAGQRIAPGRRKRRQHRRQDFVKQPHGRAQGKAGRGNCQGDERQGTDEGEESLHGRVPERVAAPVASATFTAWVKESRPADRSTGISPYGCTTDHCRPRFASASAAVA
jgi:hypothetical protein